MRQRKKKNLKQFNREKQVEEAQKIHGNVTEINYDFTKLREDLDNYALQGIKKVQVEVSQLLGMIAEYERLAKIHCELQIAALQSAKYASPTMKECVRLVVDSFDENYDKVLLWFYLANPLLGNISPMDMYYSGREKKLLQFIQDQRELYSDPEPDKEE